MKGYTDYLEVIDEIEKIEEIITVPKYRRCCHGFLEFLKTLMATAGRLQSNHPAGCRYNTLELLKSIILCLKIKSK